MIEPTILAHVLEIAESRDALSLRDRCFRALNRWIRAETIGLYLFADLDHPELRFAQNVPDGFLDDYDRSMRPSDPILRRVLHRQTPVEGRSLMGEADWRETSSFAYLNRWGFDLTIIGPLVLDGRVVGTIDVAAVSSTTILDASAVVCFEAICRAGSIALPMLSDWSHSGRLGTSPFDPSPSARTFVSQVIPTIDSSASLLPRRAAAVAKLVRDGQSNKTIARLLGLSPHTVRDHVSSLCRRFGVCNRTELAVRLISSAQQL